MYTIEGNETYLSYDLQPPQEDGLPNELWRGVIWHNNRKEISLLNSGIEWNFVELFVELC